jgi:hypothetical protein
MQNIILLALVLGFTSCTKKSEPVVESNLQETAVKSQAMTQQDLSQKVNKSTKFQIENEFLDYLRFAGSVEIEMFKIVDSKFKSTQKIPSQLMILSQLLDYKFNKKTRSGSAPIFYNCYKIAVQNPSDNEAEVLRTCEKKPQVIARVKRSNANQFQIHFIQSEWQAVIGDSAMLNLKDKICQFVISNKKVHEVNCDNTLITIGTGAQLEEIKLHHFKFDRNAKNQIVVTGGRFKDFLERSKINIVVPEEGKIKFKEEELSFRDDYAEPTDTAKSATPAKDFVPPAPPQQMPQYDGVTESIPTSEIDMNNPQTEPQQQPIQQQPPNEDHNQSVPPSPSGR